MDVDEILTRYEILESVYVNLVEEISKADKKLVPSQSGKYGKILAAKKKELQKEKSKMEEKLDSLISIYLKNLIIVPGDESRFEQIVGYPVEVVVLGTPNKGVTIIPNIGCYWKEEIGKDYQTNPEMLLENRVIGIINAQLTHYRANGWDNALKHEMIYYGVMYYGLPVRKKEQKIEQP